MGSGSSVNYNENQNKQTKEKKTELRYIKNTIKEVEEFIVKSKSLYSVTEYPTKVEQLVNKTIDTIKTIHEYAAELYESIIILRKKTDDLLQDMQTNLTKLIEEMSRNEEMAKMPNQKQKVSTMTSNISSRLAGFTDSFATYGQNENQNRQNEETQRKLKEAAILENILKAANASNKIKTCKQ